MSDATSRGQHRPAAAVARLALVALAALVAGATLDPGAPPPAPVDAPVERFSAARAMELVEALASEPHPLDSQANERVRQLLEQRLDALGVAWERRPWTQEVALWPGRPPVRAAGVNLLARLPTLDGSADGPVLLFVVHYDARPGRHPGAGSEPGDEDPARQQPASLRSLDRSAGAAPGAGDDGAALAAFLEALRALRQGPPLSNELWFLFTDGEEYGLLGAEAFARDPGALERVAAVFNFEGRGNGGPVVLFETGHDDAAWVEAYARAVRWPQASSMGPTAYEHLPNDTDFSVFRRRGKPGLNFAFIGGGSAYHRPWDTPANLDPRSVQHHGEIVLGLARHLGEADLDELLERRGAASFFTLPGNVLVRYPRPWDLVFALAALLATGGALVFGLRTQALRARGVLLAVLGWPVATALVAVLVMALAWLVERITTGVLAAQGALDEVEPTGNLLSSAWTTLGAVAMVGLVATLLSRWTRPAWSTTLAAGTLVGWSALALLAAAAAPGCAHAFTWPAFFSALGLHAALRARVLGITGPSSWLAPLLACLPVLLILLPVIRLFGQVGSVAPQGAVVVASVPSAMALGLFLPAVGPLVAATPRLAQATAGVAALGCLVTGAALAAFGL